MPGDGSVNAPGECGHARPARNQSAQMLKVNVWGYDDDVEASVALQRQLEQIVGTG
jgi:hypothetical protein